jgi:GT2 family glycosyltransferase
VNSDGRVAARARPKPGCRIGEFAYLVAGTWSDKLEKAFGRGITRSLELVVDERVFTAVLFSSGVDDAWYPGDRQISGLIEFSKLLELSAAERSKLIATVFRLVVPSFGLRRDAFLRNEFECLVAAESLPKGRIVVHGVDDVDTAICEVASRMRLSQGSLIVSFSEHVTLGDVKAVERVISRQSDRKLAVVDFGGSQSAGSMLLISAQGISVAEADIRQSADVEAFNEAYVRNFPDAVNLLSIWDDAARVELAVLGRNERSATSISLGSLGFRCELTHALSMDHGLFLSGWFLDPDRRLKQIRPIDHSLVDQLLIDHWVVAPAKVAIDGTMIAVSQFHAFIGRKERHQAPANLAVVIELDNDERHIAYVPDCRRDRAATQEGILSAVNDAGFTPETLSRVFSPAVGPIQDQLNLEQGILEVVNFGVRSERRKSIIIPLYRELKFIRSQLIAFDADPELRSECEIVYVVDDPLIAHRVRHILSGAVHVFALDIRLVLLKRNGGYALANNLGIAASEGEIAVLMNSDVVPEQQGWLTPLAGRLAELPAFSVIGPKLLYADQSLQHAGMYFRRLPSGYWQNMHFFKGYGRDFPPADRERDVPAVTGALMVLRRADFLSVGGFTTDFVVGDYEDSDLCLKLRAKGGRCRYVPSVALLHFERQSMPGADLDVDIGSTVYNRALHSARWSGTIEQLMAETGEATNAR